VIAVVLFDFLVLLAPNPAALLAAAAGAPPLVAQGGPLGLSRVESKETTVKNRKTRQAAPATSPVPCMV
jgi:hypothetical protein